MARREIQTDYSVLGDTINVAARLESKAKPGQIIIGPDTFEAIRHEISCERIGPLELKGKQKKVDAFQVRLEGEAN